MESMFGSNPGNLKMYYYVPESVKGFKNVPLLVALHGCSQDADELAETTGWNKIADSGKFIILYPEQRRINNPSNCFNWFMEKDYSSDGEIVSILEMIAKISNLYSIDENNISVYGMSAGAAMAVNLMVYNPCVFKTGCVLAGGPFAHPKNGMDGLAAMNKPKDLSPEEWKTYLVDTTSCVPKLIVAHGTKDPVVDFKNSIELIDQWCGWNSISTKPIALEQKFDGKTDIQRITFGNGSNPDIIFYKVEESGHVVLVNPGEGSLKRGGKTGVFARDINFHSTYFFAKDMGLIE